MSDMPNGFPPPNQQPPPSGPQYPGSAMPPQQPGYPTMPQQPAYNAAPPQQGMPPQPPQQPYQGMPQQAYPGVQQQPGPGGYPGQAEYAASMGYGAAPAGDQLKYDASGKPKYPAPYLAAIIVLGIGFVFAIISLVDNFSSLSQISEFLGDDHELTGIVRLLAWVSLATVVINAVAYVGIVLGMPWGRIIYPVTFIVNIIVVIIVFAQLGGVDGLNPVGMISFVLPILVIVALWVPISTKYLKAMAQWRARQQGAAPAF